MEPLATVDDVMSGYIPACLDAARSFLQEATHKGAGDLRMHGSPQAVMRKFLASVDHVIEIACATGSSAGDHRQALSCASRSEFDATISRLQQQASASAEPSRLVVQALHGSTLGVYKDAARIWTYPQGVSYTHACSTCNGAGNVTCNTCQGQGRVICRSCHGTSSLSCATCFGTGNGYRDHQGRQYACSSCNGTGKKHCHHCVMGREQCGACFGSGRSKCIPCAATGRITETAWIHATVIPRYHLVATAPADVPPEVQSSVEHLGIANLAPVSLVSPARLQSTSGVIRVEYDLAIPFAHVPLRLHGLEQTWVFFGWPVRIHDSKGIVERLMQEEADQLARFSRSFPWWGFRAKAKPLVQSILQAKVHYDILVQNTSTRDAAAIASNLQQSVSSDYVERFAGAMHDIMRQAYVRLLVWQTFLIWLVINGLLIALVSYVNASVSSDLTQSDWQATFIPTLFSDPRFVGTHHNLLVVFPTTAFSEWIVLIGLAIPSLLLSMLLRRSKWSAWVSDLTKAQDGHAESFRTWLRSRLGWTGRKWPTAIVFVASLVMCGIEFSTFPMAVDAQGNIYGLPQTSIISEFTLERVYDPVTKSWFGN